VLPYWHDAGSFAREHGVRVAIEPHPGFVVYNTATMLRLREAAGENVGANFDPSHLFWQQIDPLAAARALAGAIFHVHAKDTGFDPGRLALDGVLETRREPDERAWTFRSVGDGHPVGFWRDLAGALRDAGYDGALSIEHEDPFRSRDDGLARAVATLRDALA
jgi:sugar phosphate isomerase/epimerase